MNDIQSEIVLNCPEQVKDDLEIKPVLVSTMCESKEVQTHNKFDSEENEIQIIAVEENFVSSVQSSTLYRTVDHNDKSMDSFQQVIEDETEIAQRNSVINDEVKIEHIESKFDSNATTAFNEENSNVTSEENTNVYFQKEQIQFFGKKISEQESDNIASKFSQLYVNVHQVVSNTDGDSQKSPEILYEMENLGSELTIECLPEEIVDMEEGDKFDSGTNNHHKTEQVSFLERHVNYENTNSEEKEFCIDKDKSKFLDTSNVRDSLSQGTGTLETLDVPEDVKSEQSTSTEIVRKLTEINCEERRDIVRYSNKDSDTLVADFCDEDSGKEGSKSTKKQIKTRKNDIKVDKRTHIELKKKNMINKKEIEEKLRNQNIRRSTRIKSKGKKENQKMKPPNKANLQIVRTKKESDFFEENISGTGDSGKTLTESFLIPSMNSFSDQKPVKVKSRWRRSSELEMGMGNPDEADKSIPAKTLTAEEEIRIRLKQFVHLKDNTYLTDRVYCKEAKKMVCDCFLTSEEIDRGEYGCGEDCLNRLLMIECGPLCSLGDRCTNKRFQKAKHSACEVFRTDRKGLGIRATKLISDGEFILEYVGEVINPDEFEDRATDYSKGKNSHFYFMALRSDAVIDATQKGNISRFINHSCEPNAETQKWTVNGELRIGFFSKKTIQAGEEITFDYHFQRYGKEAQKCYCEAPSCRGWLGEEPDDDEDEDIEEMEDNEEEIDADLDMDEQKIDDIENNISEKLNKVLKIKEKIKKTSREEPASENIKQSFDDLKKEFIEAPDKIKSKFEKKKSTIKDKLSKIKPNKILEKTRKELFDDSDLNEEIQMLMSTGLKNQAHTLKLSRLMVRATEITQKSNLLRVLRRGEFPCRRLFLDYHGLRLIHGWMTDAQRICKIDLKYESLRLEILQTLATLPIPNKTMLQDSKVLVTVEKWSIPIKKNEEVDSDSNSPKLENEEKEQEKLENEGTKKKTISKLEIGTLCKRKIEEQTYTNEEIRKSVGMEFNSILKNRDEIFSNLIEKVNISHFANLFEDDILQIVEKETVKEIREELPDYEVEIVALALKLIEEWSSLKEVFRIPKKERIERMKEHEREANRGDKPTLEQDLEKKRNTGRYRQLQRQSRFDTSDRTRKPYQIGDHRNSLYQLKFNKHERRKLFALQVEQEEEQRRKMQCYAKQDVAVLASNLRLGHDVKFQYMWNPQTGQWQKVQILNQNVTSIPQTPPNKQNTTPFTSGMLQNLNQTSSRLPYPFSSYSGNINSSGQHQLPSSCTTLQSSVTSIPHVSQYPPIISNSLSNISSVLQQTSRSHDIQSSNLFPLAANPSVLNNPPLPIVPLPNISSEGKLNVSQVRFAGPIPPPVKLPTKWKCARDKYGRPYYYHSKIRISQWEPPKFSHLQESDAESSETFSASESSSLTSDTGSEDSDSDEDDVDDTKLMLEIKKNLKNMETKLLREQDDNYSKEEVHLKETAVEDAIQPERKPSLEERLKLEFNFLKSEKKRPPVKQRRCGLVTEIHIISPRTEEDKIQAKENLKKYKDNKEKLKRQKEILLKKSKHTKTVITEQAKKRIRVAVKNPKSKKRKEKEETNEIDSEAVKKIKETFRSNMATVMVSILNPFRKPECKKGHICSNEDFKHLARKLTHFVMLKELKHCKSIEDLTCTESVKNKAKEFVRKYMAKFGEKYIRPKDEMDF